MPDLADVRGQLLARRALEIASAGGHNLLLVGPPGAGKTMAVALWAGGTPPGTLAWVTLDDYDNRPKVFWSYVVAALRRAGVTVPRVLSAPTRPGVGHAFLLRRGSLVLATSLGTRRRRCTSACHHRWTRCCPCTAIGSPAN
jgi:MoxR-like ATPase